MLGEYSRRFVMNASLGTGRRAGFNAGAYENRSVLDQSQPSGIGNAERDRARMFRGGKLGSINGRSVTTDQKRQSGMLDTPFRTFG